MRDTIFSAALTFGILIAGTAAVGTELLGRKTVVIDAQPQAVPVSLVVTLPEVTVTGRREATEVAIDTAATPARIVR